MCHNLTEIYRGGRLNVPGFAAHSFSGRLLNIPKLERHSKRGGSKCASLNETF
jgi:hypothetical protein